MRNPEEAHYIVEHEGVNDPFKVVQAGVVLLASGGWRYLVDGRLTVDRLPVGVGVGSVGANYLALRLGELFRALRLDSR